MAHYDCSNCGASMGIGFGSCANCTPKEVFEAKTELERAYEDAKIEWRKFAEDIKNTFIEERVKSAKRKYYEIYKEHDPHHNSPFGTGYKP